MTTTLPYRSRSIPGCWPLSSTRPAPAPRAACAKAYERVSRLRPVLVGRCPVGVRFCYHTAMDSSGDDPTAPALAWLLASDEPAVRYLTRRELLKDRDGAAAAADAAQLLEGPKTPALLAGQQPDGGFGVHPYSRWTGAHWRLVSLVELAAPAGEPRLLAAAATVLDWLTSRSHRRSVQQVDGLAGRCASQEGNALAVACRLGMAGDRRAELLARSLVAWQWPDGGWNCDLRASGRRSSFHESLRPPGACTSTGWPPARPGPRRRPPGRPSCSCPTGYSARCRTAR
jgi:hypothetical protein